MIVFGRIQKGIVLNMKIVDYCESNTQMGQVCFVDQYEVLQNFSEELTATREALINAGKMSVKKPKLKNACGKKIPTQNCVARGKTVKGRSQKG